MAEQLLIDLKNTVNEAIASENPEDFVNDIFKILFNIDQEFKKYLVKLHPPKKPAPYPPKEPEFNATKINESEKLELIEFLNDSKKYGQGSFQYYIDDGGYSRLFLKNEPGKELNAIMPMDLSKREIVDKWKEMGAEEVFAYRYSELPEMKIR
jgi:CRISPR/Cas system-associated endonuclease/helicase Cas3